MSGCHTIRRGPGSAHSAALSHDPATADRLGSVQSQVTHEGFATSTPAQRLRIYTWSTPDIPKYSGCLKVGQTTQDVNVRIKQSHGQAKPAYTLEVDEPADRHDGLSWRPAGEREPRSAS